MKELESIISVCISDASCPAAKALSSMLSDREIPPHVPVENLTPVDHLSNRPKRQHPPLSNLYEPTSTLSNVGYHRARSRFR